MLAAYWATWALATVDPWAILGVIVFLWLLVMGLMLVLAGVRIWRRGR